MGYSGPPPYPGSYDPYQAYQAGSYRTNGLAIASLITSIAGVVLGIPLAIFCYLGLLINSILLCYRRAEVYNYRLTRHLRKRWPNWASR